MTHPSTTEFVVLRKTPYGETSLVVAGLSPDAGRISFLAQGARRIGKRQYPAVDLFRRLRVHYRPKSTTSLHRWSSAELVETFDAVARSGETYVAAANLAAFLLRETAEAVPYPQTYEALVAALSRLASAALSASERPPPLHAARVGLLLTFLKENGELDQQAFNDDDRRRLERLLDMASGAKPVPSLSTSMWQQLDSWVLALLDAADYRF